MGWCVVDANVERERERTRKRERERERERKKERERCVLCNVYAVRYSRVSMYHRKTFQHWGVSYFGPLVEPKMRRGKVTEEYIPAQE